MSDKKVTLIDLEGTRQVRIPGTFVWRRANDERCQCLHMRTQHEDETAWGSGDCKVDGCDCMEFTFKEK